MAVGTCVWHISAFTEYVGANTSSAELKAEPHSYMRMRGMASVRRGARESALHSQAARKVLRHKVLLLTAAVNEDVSLLPVCNSGGHAHDAHGSPQKAHMMRR